MLDLRTLGGLELRRAGSGGGPVVLQTKRLALLAYLASAPGGQFRRRDGILALFWPGLDQQHAQGALRQAVYALRKSLGDGVILTRTEDELGLDSGRIGSDAARLEAALQSGAPADAIELYRGDFLDAVFVADAAPELEEWVAAERARLRSLAARAAWAAAETEPDRAAGGRLVRRAVSLSGYDEQALRRGVATLDGWGDRAGALALHRETADRFRRELDVGLSSETERMIVGIRARPNGPLPSIKPEAQFPSVTPVEMGASTPPARRASRRTRLGVLAAIMAIAGSGGGAIAWRHGTSTPAAPARRDLVAVVPFAVQPADSSLEWLREGIVELLVRRLTGADGSAAVDSRASINVWSRSGGSDSVGAPSPRALLALGRLGARRVVTGSVGRSGADIVIAAGLLAVPGGEAVAQAEVRGRADSAVQLVDSLAIHLLAAEAGEDQVRLNAFMPSPLPAVRAYLAGRVALRQGHPAQAVDRFLEALARDSTLAPAALGLRDASEQLDGVHVAHADSLALRHLNRLDPRERRLFLTRLGPSYPGWYSPAARLRNWRALVEADWTVAEGWAGLGRLYLIYGRQLDVQDPVSEGRIALERAMDLDPAEAAEVRPQLYDIAAMRGDTALFQRALRAAPNYTEEESFGSVAWREWLTAFVARDTGQLRRGARNLRQLSAPELRSLSWMAQRAGFGLEYATAALDLLVERARTVDDRDVAARHRYVLALNRGRPIEARRLADQIYSAWTPLSRRAVDLRSALYGDGDQSAGEAAAYALAVETAGPVASDAAGRRAQLIHACAGEHWRLAHGDTHLTQRALTMLRAAAPTAPGALASFYSTCSATLEAWRAEVERRPDRGALVERLDSLVGRGQAFHWAVSLHRALSRLWEDEGQPARALRAMRRRSFVDAVDLAADRREEGRLAAAVGDTAGALQAWRHYLALRADPEPSLRPERDSVRLAVANLERARSR